MLANADSAPGGQPRMAPFTDPDRTTRARIRDAALAQFAAQGVGATKLNAIAADAGVSAQLVVHHFGSKDGLAAACDDYVLRTIREHKQRAMSTGPSGDIFQALRESESEGPLLAYLARRLVDESPQVDRLVDEAFLDALAYSEQGADSGMMTDLARRREHVAVVLLWGLGAAVLHRHAKRLLGVDILTGGASDQLAYVLPATEILAEGLISTEALVQLRAAAPPAARHPDGDGPDRDGPDLDDHAGPGHEGHGHHAPGHDPRTHDPSTEGSGA